MVRADSHLCHPVVVVYLSRIAYDVIARCSQADPNMLASQATTRMDIIRRLRLYEAELHTRFGVSSLALFGSAARDELDETSDVDMVVEFARPATLDAYFDLKFFLQDLLGREVDLATAQMVKPRLRARIESDLVYVP